LREAKDLNGEVEEVLGSRGRIRLVKALIEAQKSGRTASISKLKAATRLRRRSVQRHLEILLNHGWIEEIQTAEGRKYKLKENGKTEAVKRLFRELGYI
jgi:DNA-binding transcriptional ArsR family regulator